MSAAGDLPANLPVLVGAGLVCQREEDPERAKEPLGLMLAAARAAGADAGDEAHLRHVSRVSVPRGRWSYGDPGRLIAQRIGAPTAATQLAHVGVLQQTLIGQACRSVQAGDDAAVLVVGGEAGYRILRAKKTGRSVGKTRDDGVPDEVLSPSAELRSAAERAAGFEMAVGLYAMLESALRTARGETLGQQRERIGRLYAGFSAIAAGNPHAWRRERLSAAEINTPGPGNAMQATPYTRLHCSNWSVDQASALLIMSVGLARELGVPREKWVFALGSSECNHMETVTSRRQLHRSPGARAAGRALLEDTGMGVDEIDLLDLYSCFPVAPEIVSDELGIARDRPLTVTGGMAQAGGPYNNYVLHATAQMAELLRQRPGATGLVGCISGIMTKQGFGLWSSAPPQRDFVFRDVTDEVAGAADPVPEADRYEGEARVVAWTVLHSRDAPPRAIVIADTTDGRRCVAANSDPELIARLDRDDIAGETVAVSGGAFECR